MKTSGYILASLAVLVLATSPMRAAESAKGGKHAASQTIRTQATFSSDSIEAAQIQAWLEAHVTYSPSGKPIGDPRKITDTADGVGTITIDHTRSVTSSSSGMLSVSTEPPPVPLPASGNPGDVLSITYSSGGFTYSWTYQWIPNSDGTASWVLIDYEMRYDPAWQKPR